MHLYPAKFGVMTAFAVALSLGLTQAGMAQTTTGQPSSPIPNRTRATAGDQRILSVSMPPYARLRLDVDARDEDVLGVAKSMLRGFKGQNLKPILDAVVGRAGRFSSSAPLDLEKAAVLQFLSDADLGTILRDVRHVRFVVFEESAARPASYSASRAKPQSVISYYEQEYLTRQGGRRIARADLDAGQLLAVGFPDGGFGAVFSSYGTGVVFRSDGYPNFESIGPLALAGMLQFKPPAPK
jgi:hypothetical protein